MSQTAFTSTPIGPRALSLLLGRADTAGAEVVGGHGRRCSGERVARRVHVNGSLEHVVKPGDL